MSALDELDFEKASDAFFSELFSRLPEVEGKFKSRRHAQSMFVSALQSISDLEHGDPVLSDYLDALALKHRAANISVRDMDIGREAFEMAIEKGGAELSEERREFYLLAFSALQANMGY